MCEAVAGGPHDNVSWILDKESIILSGGLKWRGKINIYNFEERI